MSANAITGLSPYITVQNAAAAIDFYIAALGAKETFRLIDPSDGRIGHAEIVIGGITFMLSDEYPDFGALSPETVGGWAMTFPRSEFKIFNNLETLRTEEIEALLRARAIVAEDATNAQRLRHTRALVMLGNEMDKRVKAHEKSMERDRNAPGRSR